MVHETVRAAIRQEVRATDTWSGLASWLGVKTLD
jgi:hypothetical protein